MYSLLIFSKLRYNLLFPDLPVLKKFQDDFKRFIVTGGRLSDDEAFKRKNGFTVSDFLQIRRNCAQSLRRIADHIETVTRNTGIAKTASGLAVIGGILALPFTGGGSFTAVMGGVTGWDYPLLYALAITLVTVFVLFVGRKARLNVKKSKNLELVEAKYI